MNHIEYEAFVKEMHEKHPVMFMKPYGGFCIGAGWYQIIRSLCGNIQSHINHINCSRQKLLERNPYNHPIPEEIEPVVVDQIKEKFGGLRFYYTGGDSTIDGMVSMAESWAAHTCETCGNHGVGRSVGGWLTTLCDMHYNERLEKFRERNNAPTN
jgi:hypothetical protein